MARRFYLALALLSLQCLAPAQEAPEQILRQAIAMHQGGDTEGAIREYRAYLRVRPDSPDARSNLGAALASTGRYSEAIVEYQAALKHGPKDPRIWLNLALAFYKAGQISDAARELEALHAVQPANPQAARGPACQSAGDSGARRLLAPAGRERQSDRPASAARQAEPGRHGYRLYPGHGP